MLGKQSNELKACKYGKMEGGWDRGLGHSRLSCTQKSLMVWTKGSNNSFWTCLPPSHLLCVPWVRTQCCNWDLCHLLPKWPMTDLVRALFADCYDVGTWLTGDHSLGFPALQPRQPCSGSWGGLQPRNDGNQWSSWQPWRQTLCVRWTQTENGILLSSQHNLGDKQHSLRSNLCDRSCPEEHRICSGLWLQSFGDNKDKCTLFSTPRVPLALVPQLLLFGEEDKDNTQTGKLGGCICIDNKQLHLKTYSFGTQIVII